MTLTLKREIVEELLEGREKQLLLVDEYENRKQFETAYLALWAILEKFTKTVAREYRREMLRKSLVKWNDYLDGRLEQKPHKPNFTLDSHTLPKEGEFHKCLESFGFDSECVWNVMDSQGRFRKRRNEIAHTASRFGSEKKYAEMRQEILNLISTIFKQVGMTN